MDDLSKTKPPAEMAERIHKLREESMRDGWQRYVVVDVAGDGCSVIPVLRPGMNVDANNPEAVTILTAALELLPPPEQCPS